MPRSGRVSGFRLRASGNTCLFGLFGLFRHCEEQSDEAIQLLRSGIRVQGSGSIQSIWSIRSVPSYEDPILDFPLLWRERIEVRGSFCLFRWFVCFVHFVREEGLSGHAAERQGFGLRASGNTCLFGLFGLFRHCEEQGDEAIQLLRSGIRVSGTGCNINKNGHREGEARGDLRYPSFLFLKPELENQNLRRRLPHHGSFATEVICDSWFVVCVGY